MLGGMYRVGGASGSSGMVALDEQDLRFLGPPSSIHLGSMSPAYCMLAARVRSFCQDARSLTTTYRDGR